MTDPLVTEVVDSDGRHHFAATASKFVKDGLEDGSLKRVGEVSDAPETPPDGGDHNPAGSDSGSGDRAGNDTATSGGKRSGKA